jgi:hypothetical protein
MVAMFLKFICLVHAVRFRQVNFTDLTVDSNDITVLVSGEQKHYFHLWGLQKPLVAFATRDFFTSPTRENNVFLLSFHCTKHRNNNLDFRNA